MYLLFSCSKHSFRVEIWFNFTSEEKIRQAKDFMPEIAVYFSADSEDSLYQLDQWLPFIKAAE